MPDVRERQKKYRFILIILTLCEWIYWGIEYFKKDRNSIIIKQDL